MDGESADEDDGSAGLPFEEWVTADELGRKGHPRETGAGGPEHRDATPGAPGPSPGSLPRGGPVPGSNSGLPRVSRRKLLTVGSLLAGLLALASVVSRDGTELPQPPRADRRFGYGGQQVGEAESPSSGGASVMTSGTETERSARVVDNGTRTAESAGDHTGTVDTGTPSRTINGIEGATEEDPPTQQSPTTQQPPTTTQRPVSTPQPGAPNGSEIRYQAYGSHGYGGAALE